MTADPLLSVIVATFNACETIRTCLRSLAAQTARSSMEVIVVDSSSDGTIGIVRSEFPWVRCIVFPQRKYCGDARNAGLIQARGRIIALTDADCTPQEQWAKKILEAHNKNLALAIGGAIANGNPESLIGWAAYFCEFSAWMPGSPAGSRADIAGANMSYKREAFDRYGIFIAGTYCSDTEFHWRLQRDGLSLRFDPAMQVSHRNISSFKRFLVHEFQHGRSFARVRVKAQCFSLVRRMVYALFFGLIAAKLLLQIIGWNLRTRKYIRNFCASFPLTLVGVITWSLGEASGYMRSHPSTEAGAKISH